MQMYDNSMINRLHSHIKECSRLYPEAWRQVDIFRSRREELGNWPKWCFCPMAAAYAIVCHQHELTNLDEFASRAACEATEEIASKCPVLSVSRISALAAWRVSQGIYAIDPTVLAAVMETPMDGNIPVEVLLSLPEWCVYVPTPGYTIQGRAILGFFAHLEQDANDSRVELRIMVDFAELPPFYALTPEILHLYTNMNFQESYEEMLNEMQYQATRQGGDIAHARAAAEVLRKGASERIGPLLSILLYLCSRTAEYRASGETESSQPVHPSPRKVKGGWRLFPPDRPKVWNVGEALGATIRAGILEPPHGASETDRDRASPRPHVRRAHWHGFWTGSKVGQAIRKIALKWLPPIPVAMAEEKPNQTKPTQTLT